MWEESRRKKRPHMKSKARYWGSVRFYKHLILTVVALLILLPSVCFFIILASHWKLKRTYRLEMGEQAFYIQQLEERLAAAESQQEEASVEVVLTSKKLAVMQGEQAPSAQSDEEKQNIPFDVNLCDWQYILVNDWNPLSRSFQPDLTDTRHGKQVDRRIKATLEQMMDDAKEAGMNLLICSAYRDYEKQASLVQNSMDDLLAAGCGYEEAYWQTRRRLALVGTSEHHTGLAVDLVGFTHQTLDEEQANTPEAKWLAEHAHEYGFILRYPKEKEEQTGIEYESWHYRYVGEQAAAFIKENGLCLEEFIEMATP